MSKPTTSVLKKTRLRSANDLIQAGLLPSRDQLQYLKLEKMFDIGISHHVLDLLNGVPDPFRDPVGRQYLPSMEELNIKSDEEIDPIGDDIYAPVKGIVHRYPDRVLFKVSNVCAVYCRYCFRKEMIGAGSDFLNDNDFDAAIHYIKSNPEIWEVILTGGDPLVLSPRRLQRVIDALGQIEHVQIIRIHTRVPVAKPDQITDTILSVLKTARQALYIVLHVNHAKEISDDVASKIFDLRQINCTLQSQSVLLKGVNDDAKILENLFRKLTLLHVKPYYLHHLDRAKGTSHFRVPLSRGQEIMKELQGKISGICLPKYMLDIPGGHGKIPIENGYVQHQDGDVYCVEDYQGCTHLYFDRVAKE